MKKLLLVILAALMVMPAFAQKTGLEKALKREVSRYGLSDNGKIKATDGVFMSSAALPDQNKHAEDFLKHINTLTSQGKLDIINIEFSWDMLNTINNLNHNGWRIVVSKAEEEGFSEYKKNGIFLIIGLLYAESKRANSDILKLEKREGETEIGKEMQENLDANEIIAKESPVTKKITEWINAR
ncbi:hypothetical protein Dip518_000207 [Parelusimicrobium proximum]|uniref:hypothetical protein n=1 Tax=Parelusimicrobium proximum TaxID=3228953 RepID=UPI003D182C99